MLNGETSSLHGMSAKFARGCALPALLTCDDLLARVSLLAAERPGPHQSAPEPHTGPARHHTGRANTSGLIPAGTALTAVRTMPQHIAAAWVLHKA